MERLGRYHRVSFKKFVDTPTAPRLWQLNECSQRSNANGWIPKVIKIKAVDSMPESLHQVSYSEMPAPADPSTTSRPNLDESRLLISLATYNEALNLAPLVAEIRSVVPRASILIVDDNSPDGTGDIAEQLRATLPNIHVLHRAGKLGLGTATIGAMKFAITHNFEYLLNLDADFSHPPRFIPAILGGMSDHDIMIGSRYIKGGGVEGGFNLKRRLMSGGINWYARLLLGLRTRDNSGSYRCYRLTKLAQLDLDQIRSRGYSYLEEILFRCRQIGCRMGETPILFENRRAGYSKINLREVVEALRVILKLGISRASGQKPVTTAVEG